MSDSAHRTTTGDGLLKNQVETVSIVPIAPMPVSIMSPSHEDMDGPHPNPSPKTPLPKLQLFIVFYVQLAEPIASTVIYPFVNQLVRDTGVTGGDQRKTGYFAGELSFIRPS